MEHPLCAYQTRKIGKSRINVSARMSREHTDSVALQRARSLMPGLPSSPPRPK